MYRAVGPSYRDVAREVVLCKFCVKSIGIHKTPGIAGVCLFPESFYGMVKEWPGWGRLTGPVGVPLRRFSQMGEKNIKRYMD